MGTATRPRNIQAIAVAVITLALAAGAAAGPRRAPAGTSRVTFQSMTDGIKVYLDGKLVGKTPFNDPVPLRPGKHKVKATKPGYADLELDFKLKPRQTLELPIDLLPVAGLVKFDCNLAGAEVYVDGKLIGHTPLIQEIVVGDHKVMVVQEGFNDFATDINIKAGEKHFVQALLTKYEDLSPEVQAIAVAQKEEEERKRLEAEQALANLNQPTPEPAPGGAAWYSDLHKKWWVWTIAGAVVVTAVAVPLAVTSTSSTAADLHDSPIPPITLK